jgi:hydroxyacylglutathione hydrolase
MLEVKQFRFGSDNLGYVVLGAASALVVDGGAADEMVAFSASRGRVLKYVTNTHRHSDHTVGDRRLLQETRAAYLDPASMSSEAPIVLNGEKVEVLSCPGHSRDSVVFVADDVLITGDTLFNGTVGNCFTGDLDGFYRSIKRLLSFPPETRVYAGHDYVGESIAYARIVEPENGDLDSYFDRYDPALVVSTLADEMRVNPFLRFNEPAVVAYIEKHGRPVDSELQRWRSLMEI